MSRIEPVAVSELAPNLREAISRNEANRAISGDFQVRVWAHRPELAAKWLSLIEETCRNSTLDSRTRELVRLRIAAISQCTACTVARLSDEVTDADVACLVADDPRFTPAEQAAIRFAELFAGDYFSIDQALYDELGCHFTTEQIVDLNMYAALMLGTGRITYVQQAYSDADTPLAPH